MPDFDRLQEKLRNHSGKIISGLGALLITPLVARVLSDAGGWIVERLGSSKASAGSSEISRPEDYTEWTKKELYRLAQELDIHGRSSMRKAELIEAIRAHQEKE